MGRVCGVDGNHFHGLSTPAVACRRPRPRRDQVSPPRRASPPPSPRGLRRGPPPTITAACGLRPRRGAESPIRRGPLADPSLLALARRSDGAVKGFRPPHLTAHATQGRHPLPPRRPLRPLPQAPRPRATKSTPSTHASNKTETATPTSSLRGFPTLRITDHRLKHRPTTEAQRLGQILQARNPRATAAAGGN